MTAMDQLRSALMREGYISRKNRRSVRWLTRARQEQNNVIMSALGPRDPIAQRMEACGTTDDHGNLFYCQVPHCSRCSMVRRRTESAKALGIDFKDARNEQLVFVTVLLPMVARLDHAGPLMDGERLRLRNLVQRKRWHDARWHDVHMTAYWEVDKIAASEVAQLSNRKRAALEAHGVADNLDEGTTIWVPHLHAIVDLGGLSVAELRRALVGNGRGDKYQVQVQRFAEHRSATDNLKRIIRYCLKFRIEDGFKAGYGLDVLTLDHDPDKNGASRQWWSDEDIADYVRWARDERGGYRGLRFSIGRASVEETKAETSPRTDAACQASNGSLITSTSLSKPMDMGCSVSLGHDGVPVPMASMSLNVSDCRSSVHLPLDVRVSGADGHVTAVDQSEFSHRYCRLLHMIQTRAAKRTYRSQSGLPDDYRVRSGDREARKAFGASYEELIHNDDQLFVFPPRRFTPKQGRKPSA